MPTFADSRASLADSRASLAPQLCPRRSTRFLEKRTAEARRKEAKALKKTEPVFDMKIRVPLPCEKRIVLRLPALPKALLHMADLRQQIAEKHIAEARRKVLRAAHCEDMYAQARAQVREADAREAHVTYGIMCPPDCVCRFRFIDVADRAAFFGEAHAVDALSFVPQDPHFGIAPEACEAFDSFVDSCGAQKRVRIA